LIYGWVSNDDDEPKEEVHECVEHDHNSVIYDKINGDTLLYTNMRL